MVSLEFFIYLILPAAPGR